MDVTLSPCYFFDRKSDDEHERQLDRNTNDELQNERRLFCARCWHSITTQTQRIRVNGALEHHFTNPNGLHFHLACFRKAPGCGVTGSATLEHTWFPGYAWQIGICRNCDTHLGWTFSSSGDSFYGLIINRLAAE